MNLDSCELCFGAVRRAGTLAEACHELEPLFNAAETITFELARGAIYWRARKAGIEPWPLVSDMGCPQTHVVKAGRLNDPASPSLYAATTEETALLEIGAAAGDYAQVIGYRPLPDTPMRFAVVGELMHVAKLGYMRATGYDPGFTLAHIINKSGLEKAKRKLFVDAFLASLLQGPKASKRDYMLSRAVASMLYRDEDVDAIMYPSVQDGLGMNIAVRPNAATRKLQPVCCTHIRVRSIREFEFVDSERLRDAERVSTDGAFVWTGALQERIQMFN